MVMIILQRRCKNRITNVALILILVSIIMFLRTYHALNNQLAVGLADNRHGNDTSAIAESNHPIDDLIKWEANNMSESLRILFSNLKKHAPEESYRDIIGSRGQVEEERRRCARYGFDYNETAIGKKRRRIFWGSNIADDSWHAIGTHAAEAYGLYHTVALIESNTTQTLTKRQTRFVDEDNDNKLKKKAKSLNRKVLQSGIFGPDTDVKIGFYVDGKDKVKDLLREHLQRHAIIKVWKENGMTKDDIGVVSDIDEVFTRDFLLAAQTCDVPEFRSGQDCHTPKVVARTLVFESSPECVTDPSTRQWYHPDMIIGECIDTIGDSETIHTIPAIREYQGGCRKNGKGKLDTDYDKYPLNNISWSMYPLWNAADFRCTAGGKRYPRGKPYPPGRSFHNHTAYHFHNFFENTDLVRNKYLTYGHSVSNALSVPLGHLANSLNMLVHCVMNRTNSGHASLEGGFNNIHGLRPLIFDFDEYRRARHEEFRALVEEDEAKHGINMVEKGYPE